VIDNASDDSSLASIPVDERIQVIHNRENVGFAKAQNQAIDMARGRYFLALNFDLLLDSRCLEEMVCALESTDKIGTVSAKMLRLSEQGQPGSRFDNAGLLLSRGRMPIHRGLDEDDRGQYEQPEYIFGAMGAAALYRREMLQEISFEGEFFDESFFMWYEDIDLDWRARLLGWHCLYTPRAVVYHIGDVHGHGKSRLGAKVSLLNRWKMIVKNECPHCFFQNIPQVFNAELGLLRHVILNRLLGVYLQDILLLIISLPDIYRKRKFNQSRAVLRCLPEFPQAFFEQEKSYASLSQA
jgi:GT2 family glycosyltransferase